MNKINICDSVKVCGGSLLENCILIMSMYLMSVMHNKILFNVLQRLVSAVIFGHHQVFSKHRDAETSSTIKMEVFKFLS
jgi:hypothetical protein